MYAVFLFESEAAPRAREVLQDDLVSRQSVTIRDAKTLGSSLDGLLVLIEGEEAAIKKFEELSGEASRRLPEEEAVELFKLLKKEEEDAAEGVGFLFG